MSQQQPSENKKDYSKPSIDEKIAKMKEELIERTKEVTKPKEETKQETKESLKDLLFRAEEHVKEVKSNVLKYTGKVGYNPFVWLRDNNFSLAETILKDPGFYDESTIRTILTRVLNTKAQPPVAFNPVIPTVRQILPKEIK